MDRVTSKTVQREIKESVSKTAKLYTDEFVGYQGLNSLYDHHQIKHRAGQYVRGQVHTNTIEGFWSLLKRGIIGIYHFTSRKHLQKYVDEFVFRYNGRNLSNQARFNHLLSNTEHRLRYSELVA